MQATPVRPDVRLSVRITPDLMERIQRIADDRFEGRVSMVAREAFRLLIERGDAESDEEAA